MIPPINPAPILFAIKPPIIPGANPARSQIRIKIDELEAWLQEKVEF